MGRPASSPKLSARSASAAPRLVASDRKASMRLLAPSADPIRAAAACAPPDADRTYWDTARARALRFSPLEPAKRVKLPRAAENRVGSANGGTGFCAGGVGDGAGGAPSGGVTPSGVAGGEPTLLNQLGMSGVLPLWPQKGLDVPISEPPDGCALRHWLRL